MITASAYLSLQGFKGTNKRAKNQIYLSFSEREYLKSIGLKVRISERKTVSNSNRFKLLHDKKYKNVTTNRILTNKNKRKKHFFFAFCSHNRTFAPGYST